MNSVIISGNLQKEKLLDDYYICHKKLFEYSSITFPEQILTIYPNTESRVVWIFCLAFPTDALAKKLL